MEGKVQLGDGCNPTCQANLPRKMAKFIRTWSGCFLIAIKWAVGWTRLALSWNFRVDDVVLQRAAGWLEEKALMAIRVRWPRKELGAYVKR